MANKAKNAVDNLYTVFTKLVSAIHSLDIKNPAKEIFQPKSVSFKVMLTTGLFELAGRGIRTTLGNLPEGQMLKLLAANPSDKENQTKLTNARRVVFGYLLSILACTMSKRAIYAVAVIRESGLDVDKFIEETDFECADGPMTADVFKAIETLAEFAVKHQGYTAIADIFHRRETDATGLDSLPNL